MFFPKVLHLHVIPRSQMALFQNLNKILWYAIMPNFVWNLNTLNCKIIRCNSLENCVYFSLIFQVYTP